MSGLVLNKCPVCAHEKLVTIRNGVYDDRYGYPGVFSLCECNACNHIFLNANFSDDQLSVFYSKYYPRSNFDLESYSPHKEHHGVLAWLDGAKSSAYRWVPKNCRVLDIGCGFGETLGYHKARGCDVFGVEADANIQRVSEKYGYNVQVGLFEPNNYPTDYFDYVTMDQVMEHMQNPIEVLQGIEQILKPGGLAIISIPNARGWGVRIFGNRWINWHIPYHMQFYSIRSMRIAAEKAGLVFERTETVTASSWLNCQWLHLLTCPDEGIASQFWTQNGKYNLSQKVVIKLLIIFHQAKINHLITRIFDLVGLGDNRLFFLRKP